MTPETLFSSHFSYFPAIFSYFLGEAVPYNFPVFFFPISGRRPETCSVAGQRCLKTTLERQIYISNSHRIEKCKRNFGQRC